MQNALVIDDEPDVTSYLAALLSDNGWSVRTANSGDDGLALARQERPDVVLLDIMMPERGGLSCLVALRKDPDLKSVPVVIVSGIQEHVTSDYRSFLDWAKNYHPDAYLEKPIDAKALLQTLKEVTAKGSKGGA